MKGQIMIPALLIIVLVVASIGIIALNAPQNGAQQDLKKFSSYEEMVDYLKTNAQATGQGMYQISDSGLRETALPSSESPGSKADYSTTNIQVSGVDEADIVKSDGKYIYTISGDKVIIVDAYPAEGTGISSEIDIAGSPHGIFVNGDRLIVFGQEDGYYGRPIPLAMSDAMAKESLIAPRYPFYFPKAFVAIYDITDRSNPALDRSFTVNGTYYASRMIGDYAYVIVNSPTYWYGADVPVQVPEIFSGSEPVSPEFPDVYYFDNPDYSYTFTTVMSLNTQTAQDPESEIYMMGYTSNVFVSSENIYITYQKILSYVDFMDEIIDEVIAPAVPQDIAGKIQEIISENTDAYSKLQKVEDVLSEHAKTLSSDELNALLEGLGSRFRPVQEEITRESEKTVIHKISISSGNIEYKSEGEVPGYVLDQFSMDEHNGYFRIATTTNNFVQAFPLSIGVGIAETGPPARLAEDSVQWPIESDDRGNPADPDALIPEEPAQGIPPAWDRPIAIWNPPMERPISKNNLYVLDSSLGIVGSLEDLAPGENIFSARFMGDRAYLVTFEMVDPLFVIGLSDPANPVVLGELKIPGFSDYLHPYDENHIIGVGKEAVDTGEFALLGGVKLALFDVSDVSNPREISQYEIGDRGTDSDALWDHKAFLFSREKNLLVLPILLAEITDDQESPSPDFAWGEYVWQGAYVFDVSVDGGFQLKGRITHQMDSAGPNYKMRGGYYPDYLYSIRRSLYINDILYTISERLVKMNSLGSLEEINKVELPGPISFDWVAMGYNSGIDESKNVVIRNMEEWINLGANLCENQPCEGSAPFIDFDNIMRIAVFQGTKPTGGYSIQVTNAVESEDAIEVFVAETSPGPDCMVTQALTSPYHIIEMRKSDKDVKFTVEETTMECGYVFPMMGEASGSGVSG